MTTDDSTANSTMERWELQESTTLNLPCDFGAVEFMHAEIYLCGCDR